MDNVLAQSPSYLFMLVVFRISGKRSLSQITTFDFVLLLIIGEATQQALLGNDFSIVNAWVVIASFTLEIAFSWMEGDGPRLAAGRKSASRDRRERQDAGGSRKAGRRDAVRNSRRRGAKNTASSALINSSTQSLNGMAASA